VAWVNPFRFSTKFCDDEPGLYYYGHRYYHPHTGRWLSRDPLHEAGGLHLYGLCGNDQVDDVDPLGLEVGDGWNPWTWIAPNFAELDGRKRLDEWARAQPPHGERKYKHYEDALNQLKDEEDASGMAAAFAQAQAQRKDLEAAREITCDLAELYLNSPTPLVAAGGAQVVKKAATTSGSSGWWQRIVSWFKKEKCAAKNTALIIGKGVSDPSGGTYRMGRFDPKTSQTVVDEIGHFGHDVKGLTLFEKEGKVLWANDLISSPKKLTSDEVKKVEESLREAFPKATIQQVKRIADACNE
jgi:RHS repeat-associated protein